MTLPPEVLKAMLAAGASSEAIVAACEAHAAVTERETAKIAQQREAKRKADRDRVRLKRNLSRNVAATRRDSPRQDATPSDPPPPFPSPAPPPLPSTPERRRRGERADEAFALTQQIGVFCGFADEHEWPLRWCGAPRRVEAWLDAGLQPAVILQVVRALMAQRKKPPDGVEYFERPIRRAHEQPNLPLFSVVKSQKGASDGRSTEGPRGIVEAGRRRLAELAELKRQRDAGAGAGGPDGVDREGGAGDGPRDPDVRLLSKG